MSTEDLAQKAIVAINQGNPGEARDALRAALSESPERVDLMHALAVTYLQLGEPFDALTVIQDAEALALEAADERAGTMMAQIVLTRAAIFEDLLQAPEAEEAYREVLKHEPENPSALQGLGWLLLAWGRLDEGVAALRAFGEAAAEASDFVEAAGAFLESLAKFKREDIHPKEFFEAHRGSYVEFFDHHARVMEGKGWMAEAARMKREGERIVNAIPEGARPYAAVRVDLVDPNTGQVGLVGEEPMVVAISGYEALAQAPVVFATPRDAFPVYISSQCPWNDLRIQVRVGSEGAIADLDQVVGDWYTAGFDGAFGASDRGRFHEISEPQRLAVDIASYTVDLGRAEVNAIEDLLRRLRVLHERSPLGGVLFGRGYLPAG